MTSPQTHEADARPPRRRRPPVPVLLLVSRSFHETAGQQSGEIDMAPYVEPQLGQLTVYPLPCPTARRTTRHRPHPRHAGRQDRAEPADERDAGGDGAGALQVVVRGLRSRPRQGRRPRPQACPSPSPTCSPDSFEDSELGEIPKGWTIPRLGDAVVVVDSVANGSFASLKENVTLLDAPGHALFLRTTGYDKGFAGGFRYASKDAYGFLSNIGT